MAKAAGTLAYLSRELDILLKVRELCLKEQEFLRRDDLTGIKETVKAQEELLKELATLEKERRLWEEAREAKAQEEGVLELRQKMEACARDIKEINETNMLLIRQSLAYAKKIMGLLSRYLNGRPAILDEQR
ncbi:FlgN protein [Thermanaeromonas toyohensis ToBE]|uniref:FlgN protein n=1 Tax=Thermanaeromonas toyohensis ToBE TaxID=698762 RepID=A0A1W1VLR2_9FIRM|nr:flagellar export chaperone FlgN [Thermanaeromonas toyohensis]SMB93884.1 FlgN protein [Thermanaeromonas toyohensis ToBE]